MNRIIGDLIYVLAVAKPLYNEKNERVWQSTPLDPPRYGTYVGYTFKLEGVYVPAGDYSPPNYDNLEPAYLRVSRSVKLLRIKFTPRSNDVFCYESDIKE